MLKNKTILITGGTGSFGQSFVEHVLKMSAPKSIRIYSRDELKQYEMRKKLNYHPRLRFLIGDVRDGERLRRAVEGVDILIHTAALKQVPACEYNPIEAIKTNINGAINVIEASLDNRVEKVIALSTDKAVNPINLYGATKLCSDKLFIQANAYIGNRPTRFAVIRYGNVLASRGSVIPLFREQLLAGKKLTLTSEQMTRFWITLDQAVKFVITSLKMMRGGEIFVPKLPSMKIIDLIKAIDSKAQFKTIGLRAGEKLDEYLISNEEGNRTYELKDRYIIEPEENFVDSGQLSNKLTKRPPAEFNYNSRDNQWWLTQAEMRKILNQLN
ncbi:MAG: UDP-N-acetylglucosamine 4,6-dehydratase (inverting) [Candidatus Jacksonbacteria bacterium RIFOXYB2_FULL_44_15]|nr:MAG: UDP-N-acetylglucosamine 4,6-dehydratase [Parcubacteria group bacterium GW2011_GWC2_44_22]OGY76445.1 MAG: UDP-N-acetylglucosamine 4,6-dehydratase (inverting) [Candidatus Jacksonbacteria bacterium RIFOXYB2_FULL_44_15]OGY76816.1 MAG: UDP-N-acetylglucosamine 4,6-dehydratase (inverting) [Candidatus Jacksonbacteria bacterium RIFOXYA2_FULL_43_12]OGY82175.1 MAG: UDP-N-acetylglucosamine 4,6-dehydratase (inverting) [Candidatus Jacksonbacteria bacterium RIFOXYD2_FULL_43_21]